MKYDIRIDLYGNKHYYVNNNLHREEGPAIEFTNGDMIMKIFKEQRKNHKEGVIINFDCPYECGKKNGLMKVKDIRDLDLRVVG